MKRQTFMKSTLCLLMALVCNVAWAQPTASPAPQNGQWAEGTVWYQIKNQKNKVIRADALTADGALALNNGNTTVGDAGLWCIVGNTTDGYKFYNRAKGTEVVLGMTGSDGTASAVFVSHPTDNYRTLFDIVESTDAGYWCMKDYQSANNYWNQRDPRLAYWNTATAQKGDDGSAFLFTEVDLSTLTGLATEADVDAAKALIKVAPGYPKTTASQYRVLDVIANSPTKGAVKTELDAAITAYKTATDIILPEDGKAYTFTSVMGDAANATRYYMKYENGKKVTVSTTSTDASVFVCKELSSVNANEKKFAFVTDDGHILTWIGNNEGGAYKEDNKIYGYSSKFATEYNSKSDWNEITVKKNGTEAKDLGYLRLVARRNSSGSSSIIANKNNRFDQASDGYWFNGDNSSAWILTEVEHTNNDAENLALAKIDAKLHVAANASNLGDRLGQACYFINEERVFDAEVVNSAIDATKTVDAVNAIKNSYAIYEGEKLTGKDEFVNGGIYIFVTARGWMGATETCDNVISTAKTSHEVEGDYYDPMFQWTVYKSNNGNYYLYNLGKQRFMGVQSTNNASIPFAAQPAGKNLTFKQSSSADYPIMFSTDNAGVANHSSSYGDGLITWTGGWNTLNDEGSNHKVSCIGELTADQLKTIADLVEAYDKSLPFKVEVEGSWEGNPNTHFGNVTATAGDNVSTTKMTLDHMNVSYMMYSNIGDVVAHARPYRGFEFQGFYAGTENLDKSFTITEELVSSITAENPLIAKFTATEAVTLFYDDDEFSYRIPAIATTGTGRIIAVSDYRHNLDDVGRDNHRTGTLRIDLVARTSDDNGKTWSETMTIAAGDNSKTGSYLRAFGDAAIAAVGQNIVVMAAAGDQMYTNATVASPNKMARIFSSDNGQSWAISEMTTKMYTETGLIPDGVAAFFGSGKMVVDADFNESGKARIYGALLVRRFVNEKYNSYNNYVVYSDDLGETWNILGGSQTPVASGDEPKVEILPNGQILLSARRGGGRVFNVFTYTDKANNAGTWDTAADGCGNGGSNATNGEIYCIDAKNASGDDVKLLLQSQPKGGSDQYDRKDVTIWYKEITDADDTSSEIAGNWTEGLQISYQKSAYSAMSLQKDGRIALFFEEAPCYGDDHTKGYSMVYVPLTIEEITKNKYFSLDFDFDTERDFSVVLTDAQGNEYCDQVTSSFRGIATALITKYPFITMGETPNLESDGENFTYTNTVTLPFKVSNENTTIWHNIYFPSSGNPAFCPVYLSAVEDNTCVKTYKSDVAYGNSIYNTSDYAENISWAVYSVENSFAFKFKNKFADKYIQVTNSNATDNTVYAEEADATVFEIIPVSDYKPGYALKAKVGETVGYLCSTSAGNGYATFFNRYNHAGGRVNFAEAPDFETLFAEVNAVLNMFGDGLGQYSNITEENSTAVTAAKTAMQAPSSVILNTLNEYKTYESKTEGGRLNLPEDGQFFRVAYDYGGSVGKLYMQGENSTVKGVKFTADKDTASIWQYRDGGLYSYTAEKYLNEVNDERGLKDSPMTTTFKASTRAKGKYNITCTSYIHANSDGNGQYYSDHCSSNNCAAHDLILEEIEPTIVTIGNVGYSTLYSTIALSIPEGVKAYTGKLTVEGEEKILTLNKLSGTIPAYTGVVLYGEANGYNFNIAAKVPAIENNALRGTATDIETSSVNGGDVYTLQRHAFNTEDEAEYDGVAFKKYIGTTITAGKAFLVLQSAQQAQALRIRFADEDATGIEHSELGAQDSAVIYDLMGRRIENPTKGIYIVGGKKVMIK